MSLITDAIAAHGGLDRWRRVDAVVLNVTIGGNILALKFKSPRARTLRVDVDARRVRATLRPFPRDGHVGIFEANHLRIESDDGQVVAERDVERDAAGVVRRKIIWDDLDVLYFLGYALWNYTVTPFVFLWPGFECRESGVRREASGDSWRMLDVTYPAGFATHCREQRFYFDRQGLLRRLDYTADVFSPSARGAHLCEAHRSFDGFVWPTHRVVYRRRADGRLSRLFTVMEGWITSASVRFADPAPAT